MCIISRFCVLLGTYGTTNYLYCTIQLLCLNCLFTQHNAFAAPQPETVTNILDKASIPWKGIDGVFTNVRTITVDGEGLKCTGEFKDRDKRQLGILLQDYIKGYLVKRKGFLTSQQNNYSFVSLDKRFGRAAWTLMELTMSNSESEINGGSRQLEYGLEAYETRGRADCVIRRKDKFRDIIIDFKWTEKSHDNPSPRYALQLLLYQWMYGERCAKAKCRAKLYLIVFCDETMEMTLLRFTTPDCIGYTKESQVNSYKDIVKILKDYLLPLEMAELSLD